MTTKTVPVDVAVVFIEAFGSGDVDTLRSCLADDVVFESPRVRLTGIEPVLAAISEFAQLVQAVDIRTAMGDEEEAVIVYDMKTEPFGVILAVDHVVVRDGKIQSDTLIFDTHGLREPGRGGQE